MSCIGFNLFKNIQPGLFGGAVGSALNKPSLWGFGRKTPWWRYHNQWLHGIHTILPHLLSREHIAWSSAMPRGLCAGFSHWLGGRICAVSEIILWRTRGYLGHYPIWYICQCPKVWHPAHGRGVCKHLYRCGRGEGAGRMKMQNVIIVDMERLFLYNNARL